MCVGFLCVCVCVCVITPATVANLDELEDVLGAAHIPLLQPHHLHLLLPILKHTQLRLPVEQVKHLQCTHTHGHTHPDKHAHTHTDIQIHTRKYIHTQIHTHTHT